MTSAHHNHLTYFEKINFIKLLVSFMFFSFVPGVFYCTFDNIYALYNLSLVTHCKFDCAFLLHLIVLSCVAICSCFCFSLLF